MSSRGHNEPCLFSLYTWIHFSLPTHAVLTPSRIHTHTHDPLPPNSSSACRWEPCWFLAISGFMPWRNIAVRWLLPQLKTVPLSLLHSLPPCWWPSGGAAVQKSLPCPLTHASSCAVALLSLLGLSGVYHACIPRGAMWGLAHPGCTPSSAPHPLLNLPPTPLSATALTLPLCLNGRKAALRVGNGLHQTLGGGGGRRVTGIQRERDRERRSREEARRVWWGGGDQRRRGVVN